MSEIYHWWAAPKKLEEVQDFVDKLFQLGNASEVNQQLKKIVQKKMEDSLVSNLGTENK